MTMEAAKIEERLPASTRAGDPRPQRHPTPEPRPYRGEPTSLEGYGYLCWLGSLGFAEPK